MNQLQRTLLRSTPRLLTPSWAAARTILPRSFASEATRPFKVLGVQQIAVGGLDKEALRHLWVDLLGCGPVKSSHKLEKENVDEDILSLGSPPVEIDLMSPIDADKKPAVHNPPLNHIGLWVDELPQAVDWLTEQGVRFTPGGIRTGAAGYDVVFIHPKSKPDVGLPFSGQGVLIELVQAPPEVVASAK